MTVSEISLRKLFSIQVEKSIGQCRVVPVKNSSYKKKTFLAAYSSVFDVDPYVEMFFFPKDGLTLMLFDEEGTIYWKRYLGEGIIPGVWFCPILAFDLDSDGTDEIWYVGNTDPSHPLGSSSYTLECLSGKDGSFIRRIPWPRTEEGKHQNLSMQFRNFIVGGYVKGKPRLITAQGTYGDMYFECFGENLELQWERMIAVSDPGARGSHMCPVIDLNNDGIDELLWGERCISFSDGKELFCADRDNYRGHSDIIAPVYQKDSHAWKLFTCRETDNAAAPRICMYDDKGNRLWGHVDEGHIDLGWAARIGPEGKHYVMGIKIGKKVCGPDGRFHDRYLEYVFDADTGESVDLGFSVYKTLPVDINGDGYHEIVRGLPAAEGNVFDRHGNNVGFIGGSVALSGKLVDNMPGEQMIVYSTFGSISLWYDKNARDTEQALARYANPFYLKALGVSGNGYNWCILGGI
jgi:hypothetical protein